uniref:TGS domain-containing protein n=1 Tax=Solanum lycopersicum TaxID=4081 RepID=A0A3Q7IF99_SOLLC
MKNWEYQGHQPDFTDPVVLSVHRGGCTVEDFCNHIHRSLVKDLKYVLLWGTSARHSPSIAASRKCLRIKMWCRLLRKMRRNMEEVEVGSNHILMVLLVYLTVKRRLH